MLLFKVSLAKKPDFISNDSAISKKIIESLLVLKLQQIRIDIPIPITQLAVVPFLANSPLVYLVNQSINLNDKPISGY